MVWPRQSSFLDTSIAGKGECWYSWISMLWTWSLHFRFWEDLGIQIVCSFYVYKSRPCSTLISARLYISRMQTPSLLPRDTSWIIWPEPLLDMNPSVLHMFVCTVNPFISYVFFSQLQVKTVTYLGAKYSLLIITCLFYCCVGEK